MIKKIKLRARQKGFTLVELLVVLAVTAIIMMAASTVVIQTFAESGRSSGRLTASQEVQNAGFWFKQDGVRAQTIDTGDDIGTPELEFLKVEWIDWDNKLHEAIYTLEDSGSGLKKLMRRYSVDGGFAQTTFVADSIVSSGTSCAWDGSVLTMNITAQVGNQNTARTYQVEPRPLI